MVRVVVRGQPLTGLVSKEMNATIHRCFACKAWRSVPECNAVRAVLCCPGVQVGVYLQGAYRYAWTLVPLTLHSLVLCQYVGCCGATGSTNLFLSRIVMVRGPASSACVALHLPPAAASLPYICRPPRPVRLQHARRHLGAMQLCNKHFTTAGGAGNLIGWLLLACTRSQIIARVGCTGAGGDRRHSAHHAQPAGAAVVHHRVVAGDDGGRAEGDVGHAQRHGELSRAHPSHAALSLQPLLACCAIDRPPRWSGTRPREGVR